MSDAAIVSKLTENVFVVIDHLIRTLSSKPNWSVKEADRICISANGRVFGVCLFLELGMFIFIIFEPAIHELKLLDVI